jgi:hypothetical protein
MLTVEDMSQAALLRDIRKLQQRPAPWGR